MRGRFITFEGGEGVGKSTQVRRLESRLRGLGREVVITREPGGSPRAEEIRRYLLDGGAKSLGPFAEALLFSSARADHVDRLIRPSLERGAIVICDRFADSTRAYQGVLGSVDQGLLRSLERLAVGGLRPDLTLVFDAPASVGLARAAGRRNRLGEGEDRFESEDSSFHERLREAFRAIARAEPERCVLIDADRGEDEVERAVWAAVQPVIGDITVPEGASSFGY